MSAPSLTVTSPDTGAPGAGSAAPAADAGIAEIIIIDCSGSMRSPQTKIVEARAATAAVVDVIRDGVAFARGSGTHEAHPVFPPDGQPGSGRRDDQAAREAGRIRPAPARRNRDRAVAAPRVLDVHAPALHRSTARDPAHRRPERSMRPRRTWARRSACARGCSAATAGASAPTGRSQSSAGSPPRCSAPVDIVPESGGTRRRLRRDDGNGMGKHVADVSLRVWTPSTRPCRFHHRAKVGGESRRIGTMSTVPSSAEEIRRSSATSQSVPTAPAVAAEHPLAQADRRAQVLRGLMLVPAVGEQDRVPERCRAGGEHRAREAQPLPDRGSAVREQAGYDLLPVLPGRRVGQSQGCRPEGKRDGPRACRLTTANATPIADHVHHGRCGRASFDDLGLRRPHRSGAVDDDDLRDARVRGGGR